MTYQDTLNYIYSFANFETTPAGGYASRTADLSRMEKLLAALDDPQHKFQTVHVAGTKGKGSTAAMIESVLRAGGHYTGFFTSPHLHTLRERIRVAGEMISPDDVVAGIQKLEPVIAQIPGVTTFEIITALAFDYFAQRRVEIAVVEVGLGGRLDATNVITPRLSVITSLSFDHTEILGSTLDQIAKEKAGIIKRDVPVIVSPQRDEALFPIQEIAHTQNAPLIYVDPDLEFSLADAKFQIVGLEQNFDAQRLALKRTAGSGFELTLIDLPLLGRHQLRNAATALASLLVLREQGIAISKTAIVDGLANVRWPGRFEILAQAPFIIADGAHNTDSAHELAATLRALFPQAHIHLIFGASRDKDIGGMFAELLPLANSLILTRAKNSRAADLERMRAIASEYHAEVSVAPDVESAVFAANRRAGTADVICITGSLFVVGEAREAWFAQRGVNVETD